MMLIGSKNTAIYRKEHLKQRLVFICFCVRVCVSYCMIAFREMWSKRNLRMDFVILFLLRGGKCINHDGEFERNVYEPLLGCCEWMWVLKLNDEQTGEKEENRYSSDNHPYAILKQCDNKISDNIIIIAQLGYLLEYMT